VEEAKEVPAFEVVRTQADSSERVGALPAEEEEEAKDEVEEGDGMVLGKLVTSAKLAQRLVEVGPLPLLVFNRLVIVDVVL
jgi:hypothetical protein